MVFPAVEAVAISPEASGIGRTFTAPTGVDGLLLLATVGVYRGHSNLATSSPGWSRVGYQANGSRVTAAVFVKPAATGADDLAVTWSGGNPSSGLVAAITDCSQPPAYSGADTAGPNSDPPALTANPAGDRLWIVFRASFTGSASSPPSGFTLHPGASGNTVSTQIATRAQNAGALDPGPFTSGIDTCAVMTLSLLGEEPAPSGPPPGQFLPLFGR